MKIKSGEFWDYMDFARTVSFVRFLKLQQLRESCTGCVALNLGTGSGYSVMDVVKGMEEASSNPIPYKVIASI